MDDFRDRAYFGLTSNPTVDSKESDSALRHSAHSHNSSNSTSSNANSSAAQSNISSTVAVQECDAVMQQESSVTSQNSDTRLREKKRRRSKFL